MSRSWRRAKVWLTAAVGFGVFWAPGLGHADWETREVAGVDTRIYTPASLSPIGSGRGLMIGLHGCNQTADQLKDHANLEHTADDFGIVMVLPNVPGGGIYAGCWNYYGPIHTRTSGHEGDVIEMVEALRDDPSYLVDPGQIYLAGFSAGAGEAVVLGCLAPDLFAGVGVAAGPAAGTTGDQIGQVGTTLEQAGTVCTSLAGGHADDFATQLAVTYADTGDFVVAQGYAELNAHIYGDLFAGGVGSMTEAALDVGSLPGVGAVGQGSTWADADGPRIAWFLSSSGAGHNWPSGSGLSAGALTFVTGQGLDFSYYLAEFFTDHSRRTTGDWSPGGDDGGDGTSGDGADDDGGPASSSGGEASDDSVGGSGSPSADDGDGDGGDATSSPSAQDGSDYVEPTGCQCGLGDHSPSAGWLWGSIALGAGRRRSRT